ncbi:MAG: GAF domain-containing protein [Deltaproteobacteria bacterium]|nr:GAF domain-containing protein [Deltaproteobacteria bacterium]
MIDRSPRERVAALRASVSRAEGELAALEGRSAQDLWSDARRVALAPPEPISFDASAASSEPAVTLLVEIGRAKQELGDAAGAELALRAALVRALDVGLAADALTPLLALMCRALAECGRADVATSWLTALGAQVDELHGRARVDGLVWEAWARLHLGRLDAADDAARLAVTIAESAGGSALDVARARLIAAWSAILRGMPREALAHLDGLDGMLPDEDERAPRADAAAIGALARAVAGEMKEAMEALQRAEAAASARADATSLELLAHVDAVTAWVLLLQGQPTQARVVAQRAQRGLIVAPTLERVLPALVEADACLGAASALPDMGGPQMAALLSEGRRLVERIKRATQAMNGLDASARRVAAELDALYGLHLTAAALSELEDVADDGAPSALEHARALTAVATVRARLGDPTAASWRKRAVARANEAGAVALARRLELRAEQGAGGGASESLATGTHHRELELLLEVGRAISSMLELDPLLERIMDALIEFMNGERGFLMLYEEPQPRTGAALFDAPLRVRVARNMAGEDVLGADAELSRSVVAEALRTGEPIIVNDAGNDDRFADKASVMLLNLRSVMCVPLRTHAHDFGLVYVENRSVSEIFGARHLELARPLTAQAALAIDNAFTYQRNQKLYEETLSVARARERILNHVSHELKTPIAIVSGALKTLAKRLGDDERTLKSVARAERNIQRLIDIQQHMLDIYEAKHAALGDDDRPVRVALAPLIDAIVTAARAEATGRVLELIVDAAPGLEALVVPEALRSSLSGFVRNAIENTPDEGRVVITARADVEGAAVIAIHDHGVGISRANLPHVFEGFFHTQDTERYSSRRAFEFDAGGKGLDLLRIKAIAERHGWDLSLDSERCRFIPSDADACPGRISACAHCASAATCHTSGWTEVRLVVPTATPITGAAG